MPQSEIARTVALARVRRKSASGEAKAIRIAANVSQSEVARDIGTTQPALSLWESGKRRPSGDRALQWLEILDQLERQ